MNTTTNFMFANKSFLLLPTDKTERVDFFLFESIAKSNGKNSGLCLKKIILSLHPALWQKKKNSEHCRWRMFCFSVPM